MRLRTLFISCLLLAAGTIAASAEEARLLRFPDIHGSQVAFVFSGDIWIGSTDGGAAHRLTSHEGLEIFPKFSPDGRWIAFSAEYTGSRQIFVVAAEGGRPRQLTFYNDVGPMPPRGGFDYRVLDWTPDGEQILFRANRLPWGVRMGRPYLVPFKGGMETPLTVPEGGGGMFSPDGSKLVYTPIDREFRTWKRYRGGRAQDVWIYDLENDVTEQITDFEGTDNQPVWVGDNVYFTSDREDGRLNLWAWDSETREIRRATHHQDFDALWPSAGPSQVVYECGGFLYRFDPTSGEAERIPLEIKVDATHTMPYTTNVKDYISHAEISPSGKRALLTARGDVFSVPAEKGEIRNLTTSQGVREMGASWSPDGRWIAYLSDRSGEYEIYIRSQDGSDDERRLTTDGDIWRFPPAWSPDSSKLAFGDKHQRLNYLDVEKGHLVEVDHSLTNDINDYRWSPDSRWLTYTKIEPSLFSSIYAYDLETRTVSRLTDEFTNDYEPVFDPAGRYLYFLSDRDFNLTFSGYEFNYLYTDPTRVYAAILEKDGPSLLRPESDEEEPDKNDKKNSKDTDDSDEEAPVAVKIDLDGFADRVVALPGEPGNYRNLRATADGAYYLEGDPGDTKLQMFSLESEEIDTVLTGVDNYAVSADGKKVLYGQQGNFGIADLKPGQDASSGLLDLEGLQMKIDPQEEWKQIFVDGWRLLRDWFYDPGMHGLDWQAMRELYEPLAERLAHRADLDFVFGEMGGELNAGHVYVGSGDMPRPERRDNGLLGAEIVADESGYFRIDKVLPGENWHPDFRSPLTEPGVDIEASEFILAVDGRSTSEVANFYELLEHAAGRVVTLTVNDTATFAGSRKVDVKPIARETNLRYLDWVASRRALVDRLSEGRIGYVHLPNTAGDGNRELRKAFPSQAQKDALILDIRYNGGGFIPDRMIELVTRSRLSSWARRGIRPFSTPGYSHDGPKVALINGYSASGGDAFPYYFREMGLGQLIGTTTWGGLIGLSGNPGFVDGGTIAVPRFRFMDTEGNWTVEGTGVAPDIEILDRADLVAKGQDPTLEKAIEVLLGELEANPPKALVIPEPPRYKR